jgi:hypothetical protein
LCERFTFNELGVLNIEHRNYELQQVLLFSERHLPTDIYNYWLREMISRDSNALNSITSKTKLNPGIYCNQLNIYINLQENPRYGKIDLS